jgi:uncharacterized Zn finger protein
MNLAGMTREYIKRFAGSTMFERGEGYYRGGNVTDLEYSEDAATITADVEGNYGDYYVRISEESGMIRANCDCPYDGYPCKHMAAVMLEFAENKSKYIKKMAKSKRQDKSLESKVSKLSKEELVEMVMDWSRKYPDLKSELMVRFAEDKQQAVASIRKQVDRAFPEPGDSYSITQIARRLRTLAKQGDAASDDMKADIYWAIADRTLKELNEYGISDETLEEVAIDYMRDAASQLKSKPGLKKKKHEILEGLMKYYEWGNCGVEDFIYETAHDLLEDRDDYQIVIEHLEKAAGKSFYSSYKRQLLATLYEEIGDDKASLRALEMDLTYGMDYWRLAQYWIERKQNDKALEIVKQGLEKGEGRKEELYLYMQRHHERHKDYDAILLMLKSKIQDARSGYHSIGNDEAYKNLMDHYESTGDYAGIIDLMDMRLTNERRLDFEFYQEAEKRMKEDDWANFEKRFIARAKKEKQPYQFYQFGQEDSLLAQIYDHKGSIDDLWKTVRGISALLVKYEDKLAPIYPDEYVGQYEEIVSRLIKNRGRENYRLAAQYAERIKRLYRNVLKEPELWDIYIQELRATNKNLPAMQDEFRHL